MNVIKSGDRVAFSLFQQQELTKLEQMIMALYQEDIEGEPMTPAKIRRTVAELTRRPDKGQIILFRLGQKIVGYAILIFYWSNEFGGNIINIDELYVKKEWRNQGIATYFFEYLTGYELGRTVGYQLEVTPANQRALAFYRRLNFQPSDNTHLFKKL